MSSMAAMCSATGSPPVSDTWRQIAAAFTSVDTTEALQCKVDHVRDLRGIAQVGLQRRNVTALDALAHRD
jgi:hypothetical protein